MQSELAKTSKSAPRGSNAIFGRFRRKMPREATLAQECPVCGRPNTVRQADLGRHVRCQHCMGRFIALDPSARADLGETLLERAGKLLHLSERCLQPWVVAGWTS